ncbi:ATP-grasp domain-containing protein [Nocardia sp. NPDC050413]|uniref:ATP-grasp domain-containing protein n=1 Tax=Nocardia sp. NPDC050413 TaxID=3155784 RepID=UPI003402C807
MSTLILSPRYLRGLACHAGRSYSRRVEGRPADELARSRRHGRDSHLRRDDVRRGDRSTARHHLARHPPDDWLPNLPNSVLQRQIQISTLGEARRHADPVFVKPADGRKGFAGAVYRNGIGLPPPQACPDDTLVFMAEPVEWRSEFRCFVKDGAVLTMSPYLRNGESARAENGSWPAAPSEMTAVLAFIEKLTAEVPVPPSIVIDVGLIEGRDWAIVEANCAFGAGVYGCDPHKVLEVLERGCVPTVELTASDALWARPTAQLE